MKVNLRNRPVFGLVVPDMVKCPWADIASGIRQTAQRDGQAITLWRATLGAETASAALGFRLCMDRMNRVSNVSEGIVFVGNGICHKPLRHEKGFHALVGHNGRLPRRGNR